MKRKNAVWIILVAVLMWGATFPASGQEAVEGKANIAWAVEGCWLVLNVHPEVNLGVASAEVFLTVGYLEDVEDNPIVVITNCADWELQTTLSWTPPPDYPAEGDGLADFHWWVVSATGPGLLSYQGAPENAGNGQVAQGQGPGKVTLLMGYRYDLDLDDVPGQYQVLLVYTATGQ